MEGGAAVLDLAQITGLEGATIEDLMPTNELAHQLDRVERRPERLFADCMGPRRPFVTQALAWAKAEGITLADDWRQALAARMRKRVLGAELNRVLPRWMVLLGALSGA